MWRYLAVALVGSLAAAAPAPRTLDRGTLDELKRGGWTDATLVGATGPVTVIEARRAGAAHLLFKVAGKPIVDAGVRPEGTLTTIDRSKVRSPSFTELTVAARTARAQDGYDSHSRTYLLRENGAIACVFNDDSAFSSGRACGSSGSSNVTVTGDPSGDSFIVTTEHSSAWSESDGKGGCRTRSPMRHAVSVKYVVPATGLCKSEPHKGPPP